jgi:hypothetical protein
VDEETNKNIMSLHVFLMWANYYKRHLPKSRYKEWYDSLSQGNKEMIGILEESRKKFNKELKDFRNS